MKTGFTLIELLVIIGIIVLLTAITLPHYRTGERQFALQRSAHKLAQDLRRAQEMAMSAREFQGEVPKGGYGIRIEQKDKDYILYADINNNQQFDGGDGEVEVINLEQGIKISDISLGSFSSINFKPPDPKTKIFGQLDDNADEIKITLAIEAEPGITRIIIVNRAGLIAIE